MLYLGIMVAVAAVGLLRLWLLQRREQRKDWRDIDSLKASLERISTQPPAGRPPRSEIRRHAMGARHALEPSGAGRRPLDPHRRAAAKRRIEARRRASRERAGSQAARFGDERSTGSLHGLADSPRRTAS